MPVIQPPKLDDRSWEDLRRELVRRIPVHNPAWTDHNPGDPGITLVELFAWLAQNLLARMEQVPVNAHLAFLELLAVPLRTATPAKARVTFTLETPSAPIVLEYGPSTPRTVVSAGKLSFQVLDELVVLPVEVLAAVKANTEVDAADTDLAEQLDRARVVLELDGSDTETLAYETRTLTPPTGGVLPDTTEIYDTVDSTLWVALLAPKKALDLYPEEPDTAAKVARVRAGLANEVLSLGFEIDDTLCGAEDVVTCAESDAPTVTWQISTGKYTGDATWANVRYDRVNIVSDTTHGLTRSGVVRVQLPLQASAFAPWTLVDDDGNSLAGMGSTPPALDDPEVEDRVIAWLRVFRSEAPHPSVRFVEANAVAVEQAVTTGPEILGRGTGKASQVLALAHAPVIADSLLVEVQESGSWVRWAQVQGFTASGPTDPHYKIEPSTGELTFGDGVNGRLVRLGEAVRAVSYRHGGGSAGRVAAGTIKKVEKGPARLKVTNALAATGGSDNETVAEARARLPQVLRHQDRCVGEADFKDLALATPGAGIGRVEVLPRHKPPEHVDEVPGVVSLVVVPSWDATSPDRPTPTRDVLRQVCAWLEPRRLVTTELYAIAPEYVEVDISVAVSLDDGYGITTVRRWVELGVRQHLAPLPPYGPAGAGWPFGRSVRVEDIESAILQIDGVDLVNAVKLRGRPIGPDGVALSGYDGEVTEVPIAAWQLPVVVSFSVIEGTTPLELPEAGSTADPTTPADTGVPVPVPVVKETC